ncbi:MAG TPA: tail fiber protein [Bacteroidales bacterium]|nr:tail fiber protein [Bacteroidales bacterium]HPS63612.1 tail fiber protein [Bacteroidales bacterium]
MKMLMILMALLAIFPFAGFSQGMAVSTDASQAAASALLEVKSTDRGVLVPRMTAAQRATISSPAPGLMVYQTDAPAGFYSYNGTAWRAGLNVADGTGDITGGKLISFDGTNWVARTAVMSTASPAQPVSIVQPNLALNYYIAYSGVFPSPSGADNFVGEVQVGGYSFAPSGYLACNGQLLAITEYDILFYLIGTTFGGDGQSTFALPDLRGRAPLHQGTGPGLSSKVMGQSGGSETITLMTINLPQHNHVITFP